MAVFQIYKLLSNRSRQGNLLSSIDVKSVFDKAFKAIRDNENIYNYTM